MLYELFMVWMVGSIGVIAASMVLGGLLCVWCAFKGSRRTRSASNSTHQPSHPWTNSLQARSFSLHRRVACWASHCALPTSTFWACPLREHTRSSGSIPSS